MLADLTDSAEVYHTADGTAYVTLLIDRHCENWPIRSTRFRTWFRHQYCKAAGLTNERGAIVSALDLLEARAQFDAPRQDIYVRTAEHDGSIYLAMGPNDHGRRYGAHRPRGAHRNSRALRLRIGDRLAVAARA
jgi:hypothetical protein